MKQPLEFALIVAGDTALAGIAAGLITLVFSSEGLALSVLCGAVWMATNFLALGWLLILALSRKQGPRLFIFPVACAKLPASYFLLWCLIRADYIEPLGVAIGICLLPPVLVVRGLYLFRQYGTRPTTTEEGR